MALPVEAMAAAGSRCAPPIGSEMIVSMMPKSQQILRGDFHVRRRVLRPGGVAPEDRGRGLGRGDGVDRMLQHQHAIAGGDGDGAARAALADDDRDIGDAEGQGFIGRAGDGFGLAALLGIDAGESAAVSTSEMTGREKRSANSISRTALR